MLNLIVKGTRFEAARAASARGVPFVFVNSTRHGETVGVTSDTFWHSIAAWFAEDVAAKPPYAAGSLLHYASVGEPD